jgi:hypothetical protein
MLRLGSKLLQAGLRKRSYLRKSCRCIEKKTSATVLRKAA